MSYIVTKTINGRQYQYLQTSYRVGKKVRTKSKYLGPIAAASSFEHVPRFDEQKELERQRAKEAAYNSMVERFHREVGLTVTQGDPVPVEKPPTEIFFASRSANEQPSKEDGPAEAGPRDQ